jgi:hypothetical protein
MNFDDNNACTVDACDPMMASLHLPVNPTTVTRYHGLCDR